MPADFTSLIKPENLWLFLVLAVWSIIWKGFALWQAAGRRQRSWFIALLILNTVGILEIVYLFFVVEAQNKKSDDMDGEKEEKDNADRD